MKQTKADTERRLIAELVQIERRSDYLGTKYDELVLELRDVENKRKEIAARKQLVMALLEQLGVQL